MAIGERVKVQAYGAVEGRVQTLTSCRALRFNLFDSLHDRTVSCYLQEGQEGIMREAWGRRASVEGLISREAQSGRPVAIRQISRVKIIGEVEPGSYLHARAVSPLRPGDPMPEKTIRRLRNA